MDKVYSKNIALLKAFADPNRLLIIDMLTNYGNDDCGELCACMILEKMGITQPTLSHHMKILCDCGLVSGRKQGKWIYYTMNKIVVDDFLLFLRDITAIKNDCLCGEGVKKNNEMCEC